MSGNLSTAADDPNTGFFAGSTRRTLGSLPLETRRKTVQYNPAIVIPFIHLEAIMTHIGQTVRLGRSISIVALLASLVAAAPAAEAYEVWVTDQSDTGKESGGYLHIYDGAKLAADPASARPVQTLDLSGEIGKFCEEATKKAVRRPHMLFFNAAQDHVILSF
jgi:hypothetical protein